MRIATLPIFSLAVLLFAGATLPVQAATSAGAQRVALEQGSDTSYAIVHAGQRTTFVGNHRGGDTGIDTLKKQFAGNFICFHQSGKTYVVRDPAVLAKVGAAWARTGKLGEDMNKFDAQMRVKSQAMTALSGDMTAASRGADSDRAALEGLGKRMDELGKTMDAAGRQMDALGKQLERESKLADATSRSLLQASVAGGTAQVVPLNIP
jgi:hypothetical protein